MGKAQQGTGILESPSGADRRNADFQTLSRLDPSNRQLRSLLQFSKQVGSLDVTSVLSHPYSALLGTSLPSNSLGDMGQSRFIHP